MFNLPHMNKVGRCVRRRCSPFELSYADKIESTRADQQVTVQPELKERAFAVTIGVYTDSVLSIRILRKASKTWEIGFNRHAVLWMPSLTTLQACSSSTALEFSLSRSARSPSRNTSMCPKNWVEQK
jgi:hypothetical protein